MHQVIQAWIRGDYEPPVARLVGFRLKSFENGTATVVLECDQRHHNPMGTVHGGILSDLADAAMGVAMASTLEEGQSFTTLELQIRFFKAVQAGTVAAAASAVHRGRRTGVLECKLTDQEGALVAQACSTCLIR